MRARLPYGSFELGQVSQGLIVVYYGLLLAPALPALRQVWKPALGVGLAGLLAVGLWQAALAQPDSRLHLDVLNLPDGPAVLLRAPDGQVWLVNGSSQSDAPEGWIELNANISAVEVVTDGEKLWVERVVR